MMQYLKIQKYKKEDYLNLKHGDILFIIDPECVNEEIFFPSIIKREYNKLHDIINEGLNDEYYDLTKNDELIYFKENREATFIRNNAYYFVMHKNGDPLKLIEYFNDPFVFSYIRDIICNGKILLNNIKIPEKILPDSFSDNSIKRAISYCEKYYNNDHNSKIANKFTKLGFILMIIFKFIPDKYIELIWDYIFAILFK